MADEKHSSNNSTNFRNEMCATLDTSYRYRDIKSFDKDIYIYNYIYTASYAQYHITELIYSRN